MINNIILHDHRFDIRHCAQNPQLHVGPFHNLIRFLNAVNTSHCLISLPSEFHNTGDKVVQDIMLRLFLLYVYWLVSRSMEPQT